MRISFVIPAYNEAKIIKKCLTSVFKEIERAQAAGTPVEADVVVVNNASTDKTREVALTFPKVTVVDERLKGLVYARRAGFVATAGELMANIDADVVIPEGWLTTVVDEFAQDANLVALSGPFVLHDMSPLYRTLTKVWYFLGWLLAGFRVQGGNFIIRRDAWQKAGGFDTSIAFYGEDADVGRRMKKQGTVKWSWRLPVYTSGRRLKKEGILKTALTYGINHLWITFFSRPFTHQHKDIRLE